LKTLRTNSEKFTKSNVVLYPDSHPNSYYSILEITKTKHIKALRPSYVLIPLTTVSKILDILNDKRYTLETMNEFFYMASSYTFQDTTEGIDIKLKVSSPSKKRKSSGSNDDSPNKKAKKEPTPKTKVLSPRFPSFTFGKDSERYIILQHLYEIVGKDLRSKFRKNGSILNVNITQSLYPNGYAILNLMFPKLKYELVAYSKIKLFFEDVSSKIWENIDSSFDLKSPTLIPEEIHPDSIKEMKENADEKSLEGIYNKRKKPTDVNENENLTTTTTTTTTTQTPTTTTPTATPTTVIPTPETPLPIQQDEIMMEFLDEFEATKEN